jgi:signal peptidase I
MFRRDEEDDEEAPRPHDRSWSTRIAWLTLFGGGALVVTRLSLATVVEIHGDGMAPTLVDGDEVVIVRSAWSIGRGDIVVYDPSAATPGVWGRDVPVEGDDPNGAAGDGKEYPDVRRDPNRDLRNTAVVDRDELGENWEKVKQRSDGIADRERMPLRLGRVLAVPGDVVTFNIEGGAALGLAVDGEPVPQKPGEPIRISLRGDLPDGVEPPPPSLRALAYETTDERRYPVLVSARSGLPGWEGLSLPDPGAGPVELEAPGYLVVADNRDGGACCDSRRLGWIPQEAIRGKVLARLAGDPAATPDLDPSARGFLWKP